MDAPLVSIVIPVHNGANYLRAAIDSALAQENGAFETLVVNDGSDDHGATEAIALSYGDKIRYFAKPNGGVASALNFGLWNMRGDLFSWLSHDDVYLPGKCAAQRKFWIDGADPRAVVYSDFDLIDADGRRAPGRPCPVLRDADALLSIWGGEARLNGCAVLIPKDLLAGAGGFDETLPTTQDYDLWMRLAPTVRFRKFPEVVLLSRHHPAQGSRIAARAHRLECAALYARHVPSLLEYVRAADGGFRQAATLLAGGVAQRAGDFGLSCMGGLFRAFQRDLTPAERRLLFSRLIPQLPRTALRLLWWNLPARLRDALRPTAYAVIGATRKAAFRLAASRALLKLK